MATSPSTSAHARRYRSELRERQAGETRRAVIDAALGLFVDKGWVGTGMREVAESAGVALETVYSHFKSKQGLLRAVIDEVAVGDDAPIAMAERPAFQAMGKGSRAVRVEAAAQFLVAVQVRTAPVARLLRSAALADDSVTPMLAATRERQRQDTATALGLILGRPASPDERDGVWAVISPEVYDLLVGQSGWTPDQYQSWIEATLGRLLPRS